MARLQLDEGVESEEADEFVNGKRRKVHHQQERVSSCFACSFTLNETE